MNETLPPQPPPDAPAPPAGETALRSRKKMNWLVGVGTVAVVFCGLALWIPTQIRSRRSKIDLMTEAVGNARQIGIALFEFETEYGRFPDASTVEAVREDNDSPLTLIGDSSNSGFAQLIAAGICQSEAMFYVRIKGAVRPDGKFDSDATALAHGECVFAYIETLDTAVGAERPIVFGPIIPGTRTVDPSSNGGKAVILKLDNSVTSLTVDASGRIIYNGRDLLDPAQPCWGGKVPVVRWPK